MNNNFISLDGLSIFYSNIKEWLKVNFSEKLHIHEISEINGLQERLDDLIPPLDIETTDDVIIRINQLTRMVNDMSSTINALTPAIGELYISTSDVDPSLRFGGTWRQIKDTFLLAAGDLYVAGSVGGEAEHILTIEEMPSHTHTFKRHMLDNQDDGVNTGQNGYGVTNKTIDVYEAVTSNTGGGLPHNNMPPYLTVYVWERVS